PEAPSLTLTTQAQRTPALRASGPKIAFPPGLKAGIPCEEQRMDSIDAGSWADTRFADKHFTFWETPDGIPVSMTGSTSMVGGMVRVDPVYTPARLRGRGYAGAVTVEASRAALAAGATDVVLFADPTNPTSNALYQRIGYVHVADFTGYKFSYAGP
ncbi:GNAT family N-acetyltransferase, partial [Streptomyces luteolifulvus]|uniref:GNAT family N-acetyltransferase n=1 Tax=Streptomyces luteolifulvus TaxID=2615112 RepID=UPI0022AAFDEE